MNIEESKQCSQLRGLAHAQQLKLEAAEKQANRDEADIAAIKRDMQRTREKREKLGCLP